MCGVEANLVDTHQPPPPPQPIIPLGLRTEQQSGKTAANVGDLLSLGMEASAAGSWTRWCRRWSFEYEWARPVLRRAYQRLLTSEPCVAAGGVELIHRSCFFWVFQAYSEDITVKGVKTGRWMSRSAGVYIYCTARTVNRSAGYSPRIHCCKHENFEQDSFPHFIVDWEII